MFQVKAAGTKAHFVRGDKEAGLLRLVCIPPRTARKWLMENSTFEEKKTKSRSVMSTNVHVQHPAWGPAACNTGKQQTGNTGKLGGGALTRAGSGLVLPNGFS